MENNPVMFVDPNGMNSSPVFNSDGDFLGTTISGYKGEILVMDEDDFTKDMDDNQALKKGTKLKEANISKYADSKVLSHVANRKLDDGLNHDEYINVVHDPDYVTKGRSVGVSNFAYLGKDEEGAMFNILSGSGWRDGPYESTVENIRNTINIHEVDAHGKSKIGRGADHFKAYEMQIMNPQYRKSRTKIFLLYLLGAGHSIPAENSSIGKRLVH
jgi:hypothetical protein